MGIKGIYQELGSGQRIALAKLAAESLETNNRPLRLAIDISIWQFQAQAARGGTNPAIRTLFYRLVRLLAAPIQPIFVFDGPHKPAVKRNKRSGRGDGVSTALAKRLVRLFGFAYHDAPGEAEAECALLQRHGIVDAVLSEDVDTIMFGCTRTIRNWSGEKKSAKPTHVSLYDTSHKEIKDRGLDREGMVLVALMSGGDYMPDGIPGCGIKVACEAARAGYGRSLCRLKASDTDGIAAWKRGLAEELKTNENGYFRTKHSSLTLPTEFPKMEILRLYTHPVVSPTSDLESIRTKLSTQRSIQLEDLREFCRETFDWDFRGGAFKFIRVLSDALLVQQLRQHAAEGSTSRLVTLVTKQRTAFSTDMTPELRVTFTPAEAVPIDYSTEVEESIAHARDGLALNSDEETEAVATEVGDNTKEFDPTKPCLTWVLEVLARQTIPATIQAWEDEKAAKALRKSPKKAARAETTKAVKTNMPQGAIEGFVKVTKKTAQPVLSNEKNKPSEPLSSPPTSLPPHTPPSKQRSPQAKKKTFEPTSRLPGTNRSSKTNSASEPILIDSSPPTTPVTTRKPARSDAQSVSPRHSQVPSSIRAIDAGSSVPNQMRSNTVPQVPSSSQVSQQTPRKLKQTTLSSFTSRGSPQLVSSRQMGSPGRKKGAPKSPTRVTYDSESDLEPISLIAAKLPSSPTKRRSGTPGAASPRDGSPSKTSPRKKLLIPDSKGMLTELEVDATERDEVLAREDARLAAAGSKSRVTRLSDLSVIDLTQEE